LGEGFRERVFDLCKRSTIAGTTPDLPEMRLVQKLNCNNAQTQAAIEEEFRSQN
jgi:hypothetical protein